MNYKYMFRIFRKLVKEFNAVINNNEDLDILLDNFYIVITKDNKIHYIEFSTDLSKFLFYYGFKDIVYIACSSKYIISNEFKQYPSYFDSEIGKIGKKYLIKHYGKANIHYYYKNVCKKFGDTI